MYSLGKEYCVGIEYCQHTEGYAGISCQLSGQVCGLGILYCVGKEYCVSICGYRVICEYRVMSVLKDMLVSPARSGNNCVAYSFV